LAENLGDKVLTVEQGYWYGSMTVTVMERARRKQRGSQMTMMMEFFARGLVVTRPEKNNLHSRPRDVVRVGDSHHPDGN